ncbi:MAG: hypothetical protein LBP95_06790 [Deltaproteobacteria bacterium]|jgi:hypothetical protein|nr:hypothetical protein [Deltaproteobacteria bacterium]
MGPPLKKYRPSKKVPAKKLWTALGASKRGDPQKRHVKKGPFFRKCHAKLARPGKNTAPRKKYRPKSCGRRLAPPKEAIRKNATLKMDRFFENATRNGPAPKIIFSQKFWIEPVGI